MHRLFREELDSAVGVSDFVIAQNVDIRGFSDWSLEVDSAQTALFIKKIYAKLIDKYFADASFVKPTGDGLLVVVAFEEPDLTQVATKAVANALAIVKEFPSLCDDEDMINFPVPKDIGIGIARGAASRLASEQLTLDYSGRVLNLASRLMDLARPRGVVLDSGFGLNLLPEDVADLFHDDSAILKGISPNVPLAIHCWPDEVAIPAWQKRPLEEERWEHKELTYTLKELQEMSFERYRVDLNPPIFSGSTPEAEVAFPAVTPQGHKGKGIRYLPVPLEVSSSLGMGYTAFRIEDLIAAMEKRGVKANWQLTIKVSYRVQ